MAHGIGQAAYNQAKETGGNLDVLGRASPISMELSEHILVELRLLNLLVANMAGIRDDLEKLRSQIIGGLSE